MRDGIRGSVRVGGSNEICERFESTASLSPALPSRLQAQAGFGGRQALRMARTTHPTALRLEVFLAEGRRSEIGPEAPHDRGVSHLLDRLFHKGAALQFSDLTMRLLGSLFPQCGLDEPGFLFSHRLLRSVRWASLASPRLMSYHAAFCTSIVDAAAEVR
jgi:hypothetical protein